MSSIRRPLPALALGLALATGLLVILEIGARLLAPARIPDHSAPMAGDPLSMQPHPYLLWEHSLGPRQEQGVQVDINSLGLRGPEPTLPKPPGTRRILAVGDSSVYGFGVPLDDAFVSVMAQAMGGSEADIEGLPAAIPGYSTLQLLNLLELRALRLEPDLLVIAAIWSDNATAAVEDAELMNRYRTYDRGIGRSALARLIHWEIAVQRGEQAANRADYSLRAPHPDGALQRVPLHRYHGNLMALAALAQEHGAAVAFLVLPHPSDLPGAGPNPSSFHEYRDVMRYVAAELEAPIVHGDTVFGESGHDRDTLFIDNIHPSATGHRLLGQALAEALTDWERDTRP